MLSHALRPRGGLGLRPPASIGGSPLPGDPGEDVDTGGEGGRPAPFILAQAGGAPAAGAVADPMSPAARAAARAKQVQEDATPKFRFGFGPIRWGGSVSDVFNYAQGTAGGGEGQSTAHTQNISLSGATYFWQPWFAMVSGGVGLSFSQETTERTAAIQESREASATAVSGSLSASILPLTRFPLVASVSASDSRVSGDQIALVPTQTFRWSLSQTYAPAGSRANYRAAVNQSYVTTPNDRAEVTSIAGGMATTLAKNQRLEVTADYSDVGTRSLGDSFETFLVAARHDYNPADNLTINSSADLSYVNQDPGAGTVAVLATTTIAQAGTSVAWRPEDEEIPLSVGGSGRYVFVQSENDISTSQFQSLFASANASYRVSPKLSVGAGASIGHTMQESLSSTNFIASVNAQYLGDLYKVLGGTYSWNASANADYEMNDNISGTASATSAVVRGFQGVRLAALATHFFNHDTVLLTARGSPVTGSFSHSASISGNSVASTAYVNMTNSYRVNWTVATGARSRMSLAAAVSDTRDFSEGGMTSGQGFAGSIIGDIQFSRYSSARADFSFQASQSDAVVANSGLFWSAAGSIAYAHSRAFGIPRLGYTATYTANTTQLGSQNTGDVVNVPLLQVTHSFDQRLTYAIGRLSLEAGLRYDHLLESQQTLLYARLLRSFGAF